MLSTYTMSTNNQSSLFTPILIAGSLIILLGFAIRSTFGLFQIPIAEQFMWARSEFSMAIAIQNLAWGIGTPIFSAFAEKYGDRKAITLGLLLYALGVFVSSTASSPEAHQFLIVIIGFGIAGSGFGPILAVVGRSASAENRSLALGITTAAGSGGQVVGPPLAALLLGIMPWSSVFVVFTFISLLTIVLVPFLKTTPTPEAQGLISGGGVEPKKKKKKTKKNHGAQKKERRKTRTESYNG